MSLAGTFIPAAPDELAEAVPSISAARARRDQRDRRTAEILTEALALSGAERQALRQRAIEENLDLATSVAARYVGRGIDRDDLVQVSRLGLIKAVDGYLPGRGSGFSAYAIPTMTGELKRHFRDQGAPVRPPRRLQESRQRVAEAAEALRHRLLREPTIAEIAESAGLAVDEVHQARLAQHRYLCLSLDAPSGGGPMHDDAPLLGDHVVSGTDAYAAVDTSDALRVAVGNLDERQRQIVDLRYVRELSQSEIGREVGVSQMQVSRLLQDILDDLRQAIEEDDLVAARRRRRIAAARLHGPGRS